MCAFYEHNYLKIDLGRGQLGGDRSHAPVNVLAPFARGNLKGALAGV